MSGWDSTQIRPNPEADAERERMAQEQQALEAECARIFSGQYPLLTKYLHRLAVSASYAPSRSEAAVAHAEGTRALAVQLLNMGKAL